MTTGEWSEAKDAALRAALPAYSVTMDSFLEYDFSLAGLIELNLRAHARDRPDEYVFDPGHVDVVAKYFRLNLESTNGMGHRFMPGNAPCIGTKDHVYAGAPDEQGRMTTFCGMLVVCREEDPLGDGKCPACVRVASGGHGAKAAA